MHIMLMDPLNNTMSNMLMTRPKPNTIHLMLLIPTVPKLDEKLVDDCCRSRVSHINIVFSPLSRRLRDGRRKYAVACKAISHADICQPQ